MSVVFTVLKRPSFFISVCVSLKYLKVIFLVQVTAWIAGFVFSDQENTWDSNMLGDSQSL